VISQCKVSFPIAILHAAEIPDHVPESVINVTWLPCNLRQSDGP